MNFTKRFGFIVLAVMFVFSMASCADLLDSLIPAPAFDSKAAKDQMVTLYYTVDVRLEKVGETARSLGPVAQVYPGKSTDKETKVNNPKKVIRIPAGQQTLTLGLSNITGTGLSGWMVKETESFSFIPGKHYRIDAIDGYTAASNALSAEQEKKINAGTLTLAQGMEEGKQLAKEASEGKFAEIKITDITNASGKAFKRKDMKK